MKRIMEDKISKEERRRRFNERRNEHRKSPEVKEKRSIYSKEYYSRPEVKQKIKEHRSKPEINKKINDWRRKYKKKRFKEDKQFNIKERLRNRLRDAIKYYLKNNKHLISKNELVDYEMIIESLKPFPENISAYHIDHIKPLCSFDLTKKEEIKRAFSPKNHQWLLAKENLSKGGKWKNEE